MTFLLKVQESGTARLPMRDFEKMSVFLGKNPSTLYDAEPILTFSIMQCSHTTRNTYYYLKEKQVKAKE